MSSTPAVPQLVSVNVGVARTTTWFDREVTSAIWKKPVTGPVSLEGVNLHGDDQADRRVHGGPDKAVYAYAEEDYAWWAATTGPLGRGTFGENLTTAGIDLGACHIGDHWRVGTAILEVAQPREPCYKLAMVMGDERFPDAFEAARRPGTYLRIVRGGTIEAGDTIVVEATRAPAIAVATLVTPDLERDTWQQIADDERIPRGWRRAAARALRRAR